jgi:acyl-CoA synthetase (AMP-forming)/AMP-acid ligase II
MLSLRICSNVLKPLGSFKRVLYSAHSRFQSTTAATKLSYWNTESVNLKLIGATVNERLDAMANERPNSEAFKFSLTNTSYTYKELQQRVNEIAQNLLKHGYKRGDRLAIMLPNTPEFVLTSLAAGSIGVTSVLLNPAYQLVEIEYMLKKTKCRGVVILDNLKSLQHYEILTQICPELSSSNGELSSAKLPDLKHVFLVHNVLIKNEPHVFKGTLPFSTLTKNNTASVERPYVDMNDDFAMLFTVTELI